MKFKHILGEIKIVWDQTSPWFTPHDPSVSSVQFSRAVLSDSLQPHELQQARPPCPSPTPGVYSNSCPSTRWCHPAISNPKALQIGYLLLSFCTFQPCLWVLLTLSLQLSLPSLELLSSLNACIRYCLYISLFVLLQFTVAIFKYSYYFALLTQMCLISSTINCLKAVFHPPPELVKIFFF